MARIVRRTQANECRRCSTFCDRVIAPATCVADDCPNLYAYDDPVTGRRYMGCVQKVFATEIDVELFRQAERTRQGFGTVRLANAPLRRGNYDSGQDYVLEYGELRFTFNERDFSERVEQAARKLGFVGGRLDPTELEDLVNLTVNGEIQDPASALGEHVNDCWPELVGPADRSLVHWLRRLVFRSAWLDQRVKEGELDVVFDDATQSFGYVQPERDREPIELSPEPHWGRVAYQPR